jgi:signal transduction histidine kinase
MFKKLKDLRETRDTNKKDRYLYTFVFGAAFGGAFGIAADVVYFLLRYKGNRMIYVMMPVGAAVISGLAGMAGVVIEKLLVKTRINKKPFLRMIISFAILAISLTAIPSFFLIRNHIGIWNQYYWGAVIGCGFGLAVAVINYQIDKMRQKVGKLETENKFLTEIAAKDQQLQETAKNLMIAEERNRMARELHDSISQGIHGIIYTIHSLRKYINGNNEKTKELVDYLENTAEATLSELRAMILELKPAIMEERGLMEAIRLQSELFVRRQQMVLDLNLGEVKGLSPEREMAVYRIVQEALTNIQRHAKAKRLQLTLITEPENGVLLEIADDGQGFDLREARRGNGLENMTARCRENGGEFQIESQPGRGTKVRVRFGS